MKIGLFLTCFSCLGAKYIIYSYKVPKGKPMMYFNGHEWKEYKNGHGNTGIDRAQRPELSKFIDLLLNDTIYTNATNYPFDPDFKGGESNDTTSILGIPIERIDLNSSQTEKNVVDIELKNYTGQIRNGTNQTNTAPWSTNPKDWIKLMIKLSNTLKEIAEKQNASYQLQLQNQCTSPPKEPGEDFSDTRRAINSMTDIIALMTDGVQIDTDTDTSDELAEENKKFMRRGSEIKSKANIDPNIDEIPDQDSAEFISDGVEETTFMLVEDKSNEVHIGNKETE